MVQIVEYDSIAELHADINSDEVLGCGHCNTIFDDDSDFAFVLETGECPYCHKSMLKAAMCKHREE